MFEATNTEFGLGLAYIDAFSLCRLKFDILYHDRSTVPKTGLSILTSILIDPCSLLYWFDGSSIERKKARLLVRSEPSESLRKMQNDSGLVSHAT